MNDPVYLVPFAVVGTIVGLIVFVRILLSPVRGVKHVWNATSSKADSSDKKDSREIISNIGKATTSYLSFMLALLVGIVIFFVVASLEIVLLNIVVGIGLAIALILIYSWAQNRI